jgi:hypothetical protein
VSLIFVIHVISCLWILIGQSLLDNHTGWLYFVPNTNPSADDIYIASIYWVITTLTTVGYGDLKGQTTEEYLFTMGVEVTIIYI